MCFFCSFFDFSKELLVSQWFCLIQTNVFQRKSSMLLALASKINDSRWKTLVLFSKTIEKPKTKTKKLGSKGNPEAWAWCVAWPVCLGSQLLLFFCWFSQWLCYGFGLVVFVFLVFLFFSMGLLSLYLWLESWFPTDFLKNFIGFASKSDWEGLQTTSLRIESAWW